jgi:hypothetical protein
MVMSADCYPPIVMFEGTDANQDTNLANLLNYFAEGQAILDEERI